MKTLRVNNKQYNTFLEKDGSYFTKIAFFETTKEDFYEIKIMLLSYEFIDIPINFNSNMRLL